MTPNVGDRVWRTVDGKIVFDGYIHTRGGGGFLVYCCGKDQLPINRSSLYGTLDSPDPLVVVNTLSLMLSLDGWSWVPYQRTRHPETPEDRDAESAYRLRTKAAMYALEGDWFPHPDHQGFNRLSTRFAAEAHPNGRWFALVYGHPSDTSMDGTAPSLYDAMVAADAWLKTQGVC